MAQALSKREVGGIDRAGLKYADAQRFLKSVESAPVDVRDAAEIIVDAYAEGFTVDNELLLIVSTWQSQQVASNRYGK